MSKCKTPYKSISIECQVNEIIEALNHFQNRSNDKIEKKLIQNIKKEFDDFVEWS